VSPVENFLFTPISVKNILSSLSGATRREQVGTNLNTERVPFYDSWSIGDGGNSVVAGKIFQVNYNVYIYIIKKDATLRVYVRVYLRVYLRFSVRACEFAVSARFSLSSAGPFSIRISSISD